MGDYTAISGVTRSLRILLRDRMQEGASVTFAPPDVSPEGVEGSRLNLYLYRISQNESLKNQEIPGQGHPGTFGHPPLSLDLHYLMTAYPSNEEASDSDLTSQRLLGDAMRVLHDFPIITPGLTIANPVAGSPGEPILDPSLQNEFERVKITLEEIGLENLSHIWAALPQANFRRSVSYQVTVVQIEGRRPRRLPLPVETRRVHLTRIGRPEILSVYRTPAPEEPIGDARAGIGQSLTIEGNGFDVAQSWVRLGELAPIAVTPASSRRIEVVIPDQPALQPGPQVVTVQVESESDVIEGGLDKGKAITEPVRQSSNQAVFMLVPRITSIAPGSGPSTATLTVNGTRLFAAGKKSVVLVGDVAIAVPPGPPAPPETEVQVGLAPMAGRPPGVYPIRVMVGGAQSVGAGTTFELTA